MTKPTYRANAALMVILILLVEILDFGGVLQHLLPASIILPALILAFVSGAITMTARLLQGYVTGWERGEFLLNATLGLLLILGVGHLTYSVASGM